MAQAAEKRCSKCKTDLPVEMFAKNSRARDGLQNWCRTCRRTINAAKRREKGLEPRKQPTLSGRSLDDILVQRDALVSQGPGNWRQSAPVLWDALSAHVYQMRVVEGLTFVEIGRLLKLGKWSVTRMYAYAKQQFVGAEQREEIQAWLMSGMESLLERAEQEGDLGLARSIYKDLAQLTGLISTGGNSGVQVGIQVNLDQHNALEAEAAEYLKLRKADLIQDAEVVESDV
jgi:hypothetical protein